jgi:predicted permease
VSLRAIAGSGAAPNDAGVAWWLCGVSLLVLAIGLANAATLLMVRGAQSRQDSSIRAAMGASHATLVRQVLVETALLSGVALLVSLRLATWMDDAVRLILFPSLVASTGGSRGVWAAALLSGALTALVTAATTISQLPRDISGLRSNAPQAFAARRSRTTRALLVVQTALSVLLLASAGLVGSSLRNLWAQDFGMTLDRVMVVDFDPSSASVPGQDQLFSDAIDRLRQTPGIDLVSPIDSIPFSGFNVPPISVPGLSEPPSNGEQLPYLTATTPALLKILGIQVVAGRSLTESDERGALVVLVNESLARGAWPGESAIGKCIRIGFDANFNPETFDPSNGPPVPSAAVPCREVVGVTRDVRQRSVLPFDGEDRLMQYFVPYSQVPIPAFASDPIRMRGLLVRTASDAPALLPTIRRLTLAGRVDLPFLRVRPYSELLERQMRPWVAGTRLLGVFSALALGVAAVGLYAAFAHAVTERRREMAIRMAVGSRARAVLSLVLREALALATLGSVIGCLATVIASRAARSLLFGTSAADPVVLGGAATLMLLVAVLATLAPARNAAHANPSLLLRSE